MNPLSVMEWNVKHPLQWEWETLGAFGDKATENVKIWQPNEWGSEAEEGIDSGSLYSYRGPCASGGSSGGTSFHPGYASMSNSSKSASMNSSSPEEMKFSKSLVGACKVYSEDFSTGDVVTLELSGAPPTLETSICSNEPVLSLKLGKRSYFENMSDENSIKASNFPLVASSDGASAKKIMANSQQMPTYCQVEGCNIDLSSAKDYHRKHRVCENHSKSPKVVVNGVERRFCQQCSRFHGLSEFDENKRSCRKRLSDHNTRHRKPHPDISHFNQARLSTIICGGIQQMNSIYSGVPYEHAKSSVSLTWSNASDLKFMQAKGYSSKPGKGGAIDGNLYVHQSNKMPNTMRPVNVISDVSYELLSFKGTTVKILDGGSEESVISAGSHQHNFQRALSLLSTDSFPDSYVQPPKPLLHDMNNNTSIPKPSWAHHVVAIPQISSSPLSSTENWNMEQWPSNSCQKYNTTPQGIGSGNGFSSSNFAECLLTSEGQHEFGFEPIHLS